MKKKKKVKVAMAVLDEVAREVEVMREQNRRQGYLGTVWDTAYGHMLVLLEEMRKKNR